MIEVKNVNKYFGEFQALKDLNMTIPTGAIYGLVGPNGAGKSTILRHVVGAYRPTSGEILLDGTPIYENEGVKERIATIPDDFWFYDSATLKDMSEIYKGMYPTFSMERFNAMEDIFPKLNKKQTLRRMSKGMQKQAAFWLTLCARPDVLVLDEPVDGLDPVMRRQVWSLLMSDVEEKGTTVLLSSHNLRELEDVCDHVGIMNNGAMLLEHSLSQLQDNIVKLQVVFGDEIPVLDTNIPVVHHSSVGRVNTYILRMNANEAKNCFACYDTLLLEALPLTLEEIFIYELGGEDYAVKEILL